MRRVADATNDPQNFSEEPMSKTVQITVTPETYGM
jgi:hypothetical protein